MNHDYPGIDWLTLWTWVGCIVFSIAFYAALVIGLMLMVRTLTLPPVWS